MVDLHALAEQVIAASAKPPDGTASDRLITNYGLALARAVLANGTPPAEGAAADVTPVDGREQLLELVDSARALIESGEWTSVAIAAGCADGSIASAWHCSHAGNGHVLNGAISSMQCRVNLGLVTAILEGRSKPKEDR